MRTDKATRYPKIFSEVYWGGFMMENNPSINQAIIANRNHFVEEFFITGMHRGHVINRIQDAVNDLSLGEIDHPEMYRCSRGVIILICSNHTKKKPPEVLGMTQYIPLYSNHATTYIRRWGDQTHLYSYLKLLKSMKEVQYYDMNSRGILDSIRDGALPIK